MIFSAEDSARISESVEWRHLFREATFIFKEFGILCVLFSLMARKPPRPLLLNIVDYNSTLQH